MIAGSNKISCMGIVGDGCGGGREFIVNNDILYAYDSMTNESIILLENITNAESISKDGCIVTIGCKNKVIKFDLSTLKEL
jgi:hypothetical protein